MLSKHLFATQLGATFAGLAIILAGVGWLQIGHMGRHHAAAEAIVQRHMEKIRFASDAIESSNLSFRTSMEILLTENSNKLGPLEDDRKETRLRVSHLLQQLHCMSDSEQERNMLLSVEAARKPYLESYQWDLPEVLKKPRLRDRQRIMQATLPLLIAYHTAWQNFIQFQRENMRRRMRENDLEYAQAQWLGFALIGVSALMAVVIAVSFTRVTVTKVQGREQIALRQSEEKYRSLVKNLPEVVWSVDNEYRIIFISPNIEQVLGFPVEEMYSRGARVFFEAIHPDDARRVSSAFQSLFSDGTPYDVECRVRRRDGAWIWVHDRAVGSYKKDGRIYADGMVCEITERKVAEEELRSKTAFLEAQVNSTTDGVLVVDEERRQVLHNRRFAEIWRLPKNVLADRDDRVILKHCLGLLRDPEKFLERVEFLYAHREEVSGEEEIVFVDGTTLERTSSPVIGNNGKYYGRTFSFRDITARKQSEIALRDSEEQFRQLTEVIHEVFFIFSPEPLRTLYMSPAYEAIFGRSRKEIYADPMAWLTPVHPDDVGLASTLFATAMKGEPTEEEFRIVHADKSIHWIRVRTSPVHDANGIFYRTAGIGEDITQQRTLEEQLRQTQKMEAIGHLAAGIAHEINTPTQFVNDNLTFLRDSCASFAELMSLYHEVIHQASAEPPPVITRQRIAEAEKKADLDYTSVEVPRAIEQAIDGMQRVNKIVKAMKDFSHPDSAGKTAVDLNHAIETTITVARNEWKYVAGVSAHCDPSLPPVLCHGGEIKQVILNLLVNAAHAIGDKVAEGEKGQIVVSTRVQDEFAEISISDTGGGIPVDIRSKIFDPFFTTKQVGKGTGQGLALAHNIIVKKHSGQLWFETEVGKGTTFFVRLPIEDPEQKSGLAG